MRFDAAGNLMVSSTTEQQDILAVNSVFLGIPGLVGFWPMSSVYRSTGNVADISGQGRTLTYSGNPTFDVVTAGYGVQPCIILDGTGDYLSRADETDLDILGTETFNVNKGCSIGGWFRFDSAAGSTEFVIGKRDAATYNQLSYYVQREADGTVKFEITPTGAVPTTNVSSTATPAQNEWFFLCGRFSPSTELSIFVNEGEDVNTTSIPASIFNSTSSFSIGAIVPPASFHMTGRAALCFLSHNYISDTVVSTLFRQSRNYFGV